MSEPILADQPSKPFDDQHYLLALRQQMLKFANLQIADNALAEDAVQEALMAALKKVDSFSGKAAFKTWVFAILKNKIIDILRQRRRFVEADSLGQTGPEGKLLQDDVFNAGGHWHLVERPQNWTEPQLAMQNQHFWRVFEACLDHLPPQQAQIFMMREFIGLSTEEICASTGVSTSNLHVLLYRARLRLRTCLEKHWFLKGEQND